MSNKNNALKLAASIGVCLLAGAIGGLFTSSSIPTWYAALNKPAFNPPNWIFGPVWTLLYVLMGVSLFLVWQKGLKNKKAKTAVTIFGIQLALNVLWSILFFGLKSPILGLIEIIILWAFILLSIIKFSKISKTAAWLLLPYILWVSFAAVLNLAIFLLN